MKTSSSESADQSTVLSRCESEVNIAGSGLQFAERGTHQLKGVPGNWQLFAANPGTIAP
jgi:hypothetical protein